MRRARAGSQLQQCELVGQEGTALNCSRKGSGWMLGPISPLKELPREVVGSPCLEVFGKYGDVPLRAVVGELIRTVLLYCCQLL